MTSRTQMFALLGAAALAMTAAGCQKAASGGDASTATTAVKADEKKWNDDFKTRDFEALVAHYADDSYFVAPGGAAANGSTEIRKTYANALSDKAFEIHFASDRIDVSSSGDLAYARGHFSEKYTDPKSGKLNSDSGSYITVYRKQTDGSWKAVEDFAVADPATRKTVSTEPATRAKMVSF